MTSRVDALKTNEFLRRRKLRLQQVREQSKDIAKKIRQRAKVETLRHLDSVDAKKEKEYFDCQEKLVRHLELLYSKGLQNVGASHKDALEVTDQDCITRIDISKLRGKEATELLRKKKQEKLDEQKKLLDRKLQARETANELSREKSAAVTKNLAKQPSKKCDDISKPISISDTTNQIQDNIKDNINIEKNDMGTQWESEEIPNEWVPNVPTLSLPKDDSVKESLIPNTEKSDKRLNLFALSDEMPSSLRGGFTSRTEGPAVTKPALTLVSEYLQNRNLRLRHTEPRSTKKTEDLQSIKQTILRTRAARPDGNVSDKVCHVLDKQVIPVPSWRAEDFGLGSHQYGCKCCMCGFKKPLTNIAFNNLSSSPILLQRNLESSPALKERILHRQNKSLYGTCKHIGENMYWFLT